MPADSEDEALRAGPCGSSPRRRGTNHLAHLVVLQPDARVQARLIDALRARHSVSAVGTWSALVSFVAKETVDACVIDADFPTRDEAVAHIRRLRRRHPGLALVTYADVDSSDLELYRFGGMGVDGVVLARKPPWAATIREAVERALASARASRVRTNLDGRYPDEAVRAVAWTVEHAGPGITVENFAAALGHSPRSLARLLRESGLPPANRLLLWGRLLLAGAYLSRDDRTVEETAFNLGYSTATALTRAMKRETGKTPSEVARQGGMAFVQAHLFPRGRTMRRRPRTTFGAVLLAVAALHATGCATLGPGGGNAEVDRGAIDGILDAPPMDQVHFGVLAVDATTGRTLYARNAKRHFVPASNEKLLVTSTALSLLGGDYRYRTSVLATAPVADGTVEGDLVVVGSGDPTLTEPFWPSGEAALAVLADSVARAGVQRVTGHLTVDASAWDSTTVGPTWEVDDLPYAYGATGGAFAVDRGEVHVVVRPGATAGAPVDVTWSPRGEADFLRAELTTVSADSSTRVRAHYLPESRQLVLTGRVKAGAPDTLAFAVRDPVRQATATLARLLEERGVTVDGGWRVVWDADEDLGAGCRSGSLSSCESRPLATLASARLIEIVQAILEPSQNWMTEQLVRTLGAERGDKGSWDEGLDVVRHFLVEEVGVDSLDVDPSDGSGLSSHNLVTPRALVGILRYMAAGPYGDAYRHALAEPGEEGSTLRRRLPGFEGRVFAKTGTISNVNSLSGYLVRDDGRQIVFSLLSNGSGLPSSRVRATLDEVVQVLAGRNP